MEEHSPVKQHKKRLNLTKTKPVLMGLLVAVILVTISFYSGVQYQKGHQSTTSAFNNSSGNSPFGGGGGRFGGFNSDRVFGQVTAISSSSISVQDSRSNTNVTLTINSSTQISNNGQTASASSIQTGNSVIVVEDSSNTSVASRILINPSFGGFGSNSPGGGATTSPSTTVN